MVWMESTISTCAARPEAAPTMSSTQVSAISRAVAASNPSRRARSATCFKDSSPVAYSTGPEAWRAAAACNISVDLPIPGSPPIRVTEPGTRPPPNTRSSSAEPVVTRDCSTMASAASDDEASVRGTLMDTGGFRVVVGCSSATRVFHSPQPVHCPCHFGEETPQFWQIKTSLDFAIGFPYRFVILALQLTLPDHLYCRPSRFGLCLLHAQIWADSSDSGRGDLRYGPISPPNRKSGHLAMASGDSSIDRRKRASPLEPLRRIGGGDPGTDHPETRGNR